jgi:hypothetical protein
VQPFRLSALPFGARAGITFLLFVLLGGYFAASKHLVAHHENRDEREGMSLDDLVGAYSGIRNKAPLITALERDHPEELPAKDRDLLLGWLTSDRIAEGYDALDLGDDAPAEVIDRACLQCHSAGAEEGDGIGETMPLEYFDQVRNLAFSREVSPTSVEILIASAHTHALGMGTLSLVLVLLMLATRWPRWMASVLIGFNGFGLFVDLACWGLARQSGAFVPVLAVSGAVWAGTGVVMIGLMLVDLWIPRRVRNE